jgi:leucyl aminopeptidase
MEFFATTGDAAKRTTACAIVGVYDRKVLSSAAAEIDAATKGLIDKLLDQGDLSSKVGTARLINHVPDAKCKRVVVAGLGKKSEFGPREYAKAVGAALAEIKTTQISEAVNFLSREPVKNTSPYYLGRFAAQALGDYAYRFNELKSKGGKPATKLRKLGFGAADKDAADELLRGAAHGAGIAKGMSLTKDLGNLPPNICTPGYLAQEAQAMAERCRDLTVEVLDEPDMQALGMGSLLSVGNGSEQSSHLIAMHYRGGNKNDEPVILVGKGITFDSGGISLKPGPAMDEMKYDMGGAAAVMGAMAATVALKLPINLIVIVPTAENMPSGRASRPGDIVTSMSGQTIEILNTDAEGRLILCDALTYAQQFSPKTLIDVATLTGACVIALGHHRTGIMSKDDALAEELKASGERANDRAWQLPLDAEYAEQLKSNFADMANVGGRDGGAITAGAFLSKFTEKARWAHLDIAGTAWNSGKNKGATGRPVPLLMEYLLGQAERL